MTTVNTSAPEFTLPDQNGRIVSLSDLRGKYVCLYFYPKDDTPGCTEQGCQFRDFYPKLEEMNCAVYGVSADSEKSHQKFSTKYKFNFPLLSDIDHAVAEAYGVWKEKSMFGKKFMGIVRTTFLIDPQGKVVKIWEKADTAKNAEEVYNYIGSLSK